LLDLTTGTVWQSWQPIGYDAWDSLDLPPKLVKVGIGTGVMDAHYFRRSPGAEVDGPVAEREVAGHVFFHCANPPRGGPEKPFGDEPRLLRVDKHHSLIFEAGRDLEVIRLPDGRDYVQVIMASPAGGGIMQSGAAPAELPLPDGWVLRTEKITSPTTIHLPHPTEAWFFANGASFQGPVDVFGDS
jgi:hypothetical protein